MNPKHRYGDRVRVRRTRSTECDETAGLSGTVVDPYGTVTRRGRTLSAYLVKLDSGSEYLFTASELAK